MRFAILFVTCCLGAASAADVLVVEEIVAKVNGDIITRMELEKQRRQMETELQQRGAKGPQLKQAVDEREKDVLREKIDQLLLVQKGKELSINVDQQLSKYVAEIQRQFKVADQEVLAKQVREQTGMLFEDWKSEVRNSMLTQRVIGQEVQSKINVPRAEVLKYYEDHKADFVREERVFLREILVKAETGKEAQAEKKARDLIARARKGEKFPELARDNSDADTAQNFGDIGGYKKGELDPVIEAMVFQGGKNFISEPLKRPAGYLILKVDEVHKPGQAAFEEVEQEVMERVYGPRVGPAVREYLTKLRQEAFLEIRDGYIDTGAAPGKDTRWTDPAQLKPETVSKEELANQKRKRRLLGVPIPFTKTSAVKPEKEEKGESKSKVMKAK
jgi:parvulin-like peptidyl-prolyl isomerase